jgi:hypothetical protein
LHHKELQLAKMRAKGDNFVELKNTIYNTLNELENLFAVYNANDIRGAAARGDIDQLNNLLLIVSPNTIDEHEHLPIYYASRFGHAQAVNVLFDATNLSAVEKDELLNIFPDKSGKEFPMLVTLLKQNKANFDNLWSEQRSTGDNIVAVFSDYYSPKILPLLPDDAKLILTGNWHRPQECLDLAKKIVELFNILEPKDRENESMCRMLLVSKWDTFHDQMTQNSKSESFARRFFYLNDKVSLVTTPKATKNTLPNVIKVSGQASSMWRKAHDQVEMEPLIAKRRQTHTLTS